MEEMPGKSKEYFMQQTNITVRSRKRNLELPLVNLFMTNDYESYPLLQRAVPLILLNHIKENISSMFGKCEKPFQMCPLMLVC